MPSSKLDQKVPAVFLPALLAASVVIAALTWHSVDPLLVDSTDYIHSGVSLLSGRGFTGIDHRPQLHYSPGFPLLIGLMNKLVPDSILAARLVCVGSSILSVLLVTLIAGRLFSWRTAVAAGTLFALLPIRIAVSNQILSESAFVFLVLLNIWLWLLEAESPSLMRAVGLGAALGLAYLVRPEGIATAAVLLLLSLGGGRFWTVIPRRSVLVAALVFALVAAPYLVFLRVHTGFWRLSNRQQVTSVFIVLSTKGLWCPSIAQLTPDNKEIDWARFRESRAEFVRRYGSNVRREIHQVAIQLGPFLKLCLMLGIALELHRRNKQLWTAVPPLLVLSLPLIYLPAFYPHPRYVYTGISPLIVLACWQLAKRFSFDSPAEPKSLLARVTVWIPLIVVAAYTLALGRAAYLVRAEPADSSHIAAWVKARVPTNEGLILSDPSIVFYSGNRFVRLPRDELDRVAIYARYHRSSYVLMRSDDLEYYKLNGALRRAESQGLLKPVDELWDAGGRKAALLRFCSNP